MSMRAGWGYQTASWLLFCAVFSVWNVFPCLTDRLLPDSTQRRPPFKSPQAELSAPTSRLPLASAFESCSTCHIAVIISRSISS